MTEAQQLFSSDCLKVRSGLNEGLWGGSHKLIVASLAGVALATSSAFAADMPLKAPPMVVAPPFSWTGFYLGVEGGYERTDTDHVRNVGNVNFPAGFGFTSSSSGALVGVEGGFNYQWDRLVLGVEGDWQSANGSSSTTIFSPLNIGRFSVEHGKTDWVATITGRLGLAWDRWMIFGKGGGAWRQVEGAADQTFNPDGTLRSVIQTNSDTQSGYVVGGGIEWAPVDPVSFKIEYDWYNWGSQQSTSNVCTFGTCGVGTVTPAGESTSTPRTWEIKAAINLRLNPILGGFIAAR